MFLSSHYKKNAYIYLSTKEPWPVSFPVDNLWKRSTNVFMTWTSYEMEESTSVSSHLYIYGFFWPSAMAFAACHIDSSNSIAELEASILLTESGPMDNKFMEKF